MTTCRCLNRVLQTAHRLRAYVCGNVLLETSSSVKVRLS